MAYSTLFDLDSSDIASEAEVETRLLAKLFSDLGYPATSVVPKKHFGMPCEARFAVSRYTILPKQRVNLN